MALAVVFFFFLAPKSLKEEFQNFHLDQRQSLSLENSLLDIIVHRVFISLRGDRDIANRDE